MSGIINCKTVSNALNRNCALVSSAPACPRVEGVVCPPGAGVVNRQRWCRLPPQVLSYFCSHCFCFSRARNLLGANRIHYLTLTVYSTNRPVLHHIHSLSSKQESLCDVHVEKNLCCEGRMQPPPQRLPLLHTLRLFNELAVTSPKSVSLQVAELLLVLCIGYIANAPALKPARFLHSATRFFVFPRVKKKYLLRPKAASTSANSFVFAQTSVIKQTVAPFTSVTAQPLKILNQCEALKKSLFG